MDNERDFQQLKEDIKSLFMPDGILERNMRGFRFRDGQLDMALKVMEAIETSVPLIAEGGTGIGKTLAYLSAALLAGQKSVISTGTKTLQEQVFFKDLAELLDATDISIKSMYMKGRNNYLCKFRYNRFLAQGTFRFAGEANVFDEIREWAEVTQTGDRAELENVPDDFQPWNDIASSSDTCIGRKCPSYKDCFYTKMRAQAQEADIIIVNHYLYFSDLAMSEMEYGDLIPKHSLVVFDEAHLLEAIATKYFGQEVSNYRLISFADDVLRGIDSKTALQTGVHKLVEELRMSTARFFDSFMHLEPRFRFPESLIDADMLKDYYAMEAALGALFERLDDLGDESDAAKGFAQRANKLLADIRFIISERREDRVYWGEIRKRSVALIASPLDIAPIMADRLFRRPLAKVFTSATLATGDSFDYYKERLGFPETVAEGIFPSPFDYRHRTMIYVSRYMPEPNKKEFTLRCSQLIKKLLNLTDGSALLLFTSYANMNEVYDNLVDRLPFPMFKQGDAPRSKLLEDFRASVHSVLFATGTFWQGVDVVGESLKLVVIDKLPFESPGDPVTEAKIGYIRKEGGNPFFDFQVPNAVIQLKQGVGRLMRSVDDWGLIAILDRRIQTKGYGKTFMQSLPESVRAYKFEQVEDWWQQRMEIERLEKTH